MNTPKTLKRTARRFSLLALALPSMLYLQSALAETPMARTG